MSNTKKELAGEQYLVHLLPGTRLTCFHCSASWYAGYEDTLPLDPIKVGWTKHPALLHRPGTVIRRATVQNGNQRDQGTTGWTGGVEADIVLLPQDVDEMKLQVRDLLRCPNCANYALQPMYNKMDRWLCCYDMLAYESLEDAQGCCGMRERPINSDLRLAPLNDLLADLPEALEFKDWEESTASLLAAIKAGSGQIEINEAYGTFYFDNTGEPVSVSVEELKALEDATRGREVQEEETKEEEKAEPVAEVMPEKPDGYCYQCHSVKIVGAFTQSGFSYCANCRPPEDSALEHKELASSLMYAEVEKDGKKKLCWANQMQTFTDKGWKVVQGRHDYSLMWNGSLQGFTHIFPPHLIPKE